MSWVNLSELHEQTGFAIRTLQYIRAQEPGVLITRERSGRTEYKQPDSATNLFRRERELGKRDVKSANFEDARARKMEAEAREAELRVETMLGKVVPIELVEEIGGEMCDRFLPILQNVPSNYGLRLEEVGVPANVAEAVLESIATDLTRAMRATADDHEAAASADEATENDATDDDSDRASVA